MNNTAKSCLVIALICVAALVSAKEPRRIDGTSDKSFDKTYAQLVRAVPAAERRKFALDLLSVLLPHKCLSPDAIISLTFLSTSPKEAAGIRPCRELLNGKSSRDIAEAANSERSPAQSELPNNSLNGDVAEATRR